MIEKKKDLQNSSKKTNKISDKNINLKDFLDNFCLDSFSQHFFSRLIMVIQICFIARIFSENPKNSLSLFNNVILFAIGYSTWKIFSVFFDYLNEYCLIKFLKLMKKKDYFSIGIIFRKVLLISLAYLIIFYFPFVLLIKNTLNSKLLFKSLEIQDVCFIKNNFSSTEEIIGKLTYDDQFNINNNKTHIRILKNLKAYSRIFQNVSHSKEKSHIKINTMDRDLNNFLFHGNQNISISIKKAEIQTNKQQSNNSTEASEILTNNKSIEAQINSLLRFQYLYFFVLFLRIFVKSNQNIFHIFGYTKYIKFMLATKIKINFSIILFCYKNELELLNSILIADLFSELFSIIYLWIISCVYNPFPQVWIMPSLGIFNIDQNLLQKFLNFRKILKFFFLNFWNEFIFVIFLYLKFSLFEEHKKFEISINLENKNIINQSDQLQTNFYSAFENFNKELIYLKLSIDNFFLFIILKDFFFNMSRFTKRNYQQIFLERIQMVSSKKTPKEEEKMNKNINLIQKNNDDFLYFEKDFRQNYLNKPLLENKNCKKNVIINKNNHKAQQTINKTCLKRSLDYNFNKNDQNNFFNQIKKYQKISDGINHSENSQNILVIIKNKIIVRLFISCIVFIVISVLYLIGIFQFFNPIVAIDYNIYYDINYLYLVLLFLCGSLNYLTTELFIMNKFFENPNIDKIIIYGFCSFSFLPFVLFSFFIDNSSILLVIINLVNVYFIFTFYDFLSYKDLRFKKLDSLINKEKLDIQYYTL